METIKDDFLNWAASASQDERYEFLRRYLDILPEQELAQVGNHAAKAKKRRVRKRASLSVSAPEKSVSVPLKKPKKWFEDYLQKGDIVAMDVEKVQYKLPAPAKGYVMKAAIVSIVDCKGSIVFESKIYHEPNSFVVTPITTKINGITKESLKDGQKLEVVKKRIREVTSGKLVVVLAGENDFASLDLPYADFDIFECQEFWYHLCTSPRGKVYRENLSLRSLCYHFFKEDPQPNGVIHDAATDAKWTMRLFLEVYVNAEGNETKTNPEASNHIPHVPKGKEK